MMFGKLRSLGPIAWVVGNWQIVAGLALLLLASNILSYCKGREHGADSMRAEYAAASTRSAEIAASSQGVAAAEAEADRNTITDEKEASDAAIKATESDGTVPSAASNALNCERLRRSGQNLDRFPACQ